MFGSACPEAKWHLAAPQLDTKWKDIVTQELKHIILLHKITTCGKSSDSVLNTGGRAGRVGARGGIGDCWGGEGECVWGLWEVKAGIASSITKLPCMCCLILSSMVSSWSSTLLPSVQASLLALSVLLTVSNIAWLLRTTGFWALWNIRNEIVAVTIPVHSRLFFLSDFVKMLNLPSLNNQQAVREGFSKFLCIVFYEHHSSYPESPLWTTLSSPKLSESLSPSDSLTDFCLSLQNIWIFNSYIGCVHINLDLGTSEKKDLMKLSDGFKTDVCRLSGVVLPDPSSCRGGLESARTIWIFSPVVSLWRISDQTFKRSRNGGLLLLFHKRSDYIPELSCTAVLLRQWTVSLHELSLGQMRSKISQIMYQDRERSF